MIFFSCTEIKATTFNLAVKSLCAMQRHLWLLTQSHSWNHRCQGWWRQWWRRWRRGGAAIVTSSTNIFKVGPLAKLQPNQLLTLASCGHHTRRCINSSGPGKFFGHARLLERPINCLIIKLGYFGLWHWWRANRGRDGACWWTSTTICRARISTNPWQIYRPISNCSISFNLPLWFLFTSRVLTFLITKIQSKIFPVPLSGTFQIPIHGHQWRTISQTTIHSIDYAENNKLLPWKLQIDVGFAQRSNRKKRKQ